ncbi:MAG TPA: efflux transporter outer membrane subunit [Ideonella sp.]|uniref:efflux transporter outer membrane subunit n=1 Tax=Ideonella sp. TaxID=1929293 RepID=UPI002BA41390|nr:efflux transporter outer membrane subunit [Ideonella sp.]HSI48586.1 efflux transporter outer membrane subunit [Ideonella sp.]
MSLRPLPFPPRSVALAAALLLTACATVGPDYAGAPALPSARPGPLVRAAQAGASGTTPAAAPWWRSLGDATLDTLVDQALANSPDLRAAQARLRQARASLNQQQANAQPKGSASALALGLSSAPNTSAAQDLHFYNVGFDASWEIDLFGGTRRAVEAAEAQSGQVQAEFADAQVSLAAEVVQAYAELRAGQQRVLLSREAAALDGQSLALTRQRQERGVANMLDVERQLGREQATRRGVQEAEGAVTETLDRLALLCGQAPGTLDAQLSVPATLPQVPRELAVGDVTALLQHRPDIRAAERRLAASTAQIGQQQAGYFPKLSLLGDIGLGATEPGQLLKQNSLVLLGAPYLSWNVLDFGRTAAAVRKAEAGRDEALAKYESTVLQALRDANLALTRYGHQRNSLRSLLAQQASAERSLKLTTQRRQAGTASQLDLQDAQRTQIDARRDSLAAEAALLQDFAALHKSLGLGWDAAPAAIANAID